jgi:hypothetical protein
MKGQNGFNQHVLEEKKDWTYSSVGKSFPIQGEKWGEEDELSGMWTPKWRREKGPR